jgi:hypothetical protein
MPNDFRRGLAAASPLLFCSSNRLGGATPPRLGGYRRMLWTIIQINSRLRAVELSI